MSDKKTYFMIAAILVFFICLALYKSATRITALEYIISEEIEWNIAGIEDKIRKLEGEVRGNIYTDYPGLLHEVEEIQYKLGM